MPLTVETVEAHLEHALNLLHGAQQELAHAEDTELILCLQEAIQRLQRALEQLTNRPMLVIMGPAADGATDGEEAL